MLFAVDPERRRALQIRPFRGYDADDAGARVRATRNEAELQQDAEGARGGLGVRAGAGRARRGRRAAPAPESLAAARGGAGRPPAIVSREGAWTVEDAERRTPLGVGEERVEEAAPTARRPRSRRLSRRRREGDALDVGRSAGRRRGRRARRRRRDPGPSRAPRSRRGRGRWSARAASPATLGAAAVAGDQRRAAVEAGEPGGAVGERRAARGVGGDGKHARAARDELRDRRGRRSSRRPGPRCRARPCRRCRGDLLGP